MNGASVRPWVISLAALFFFSLGRRALWFFFFNSVGELLDVDEWGECASLSDISSSSGEESAPPSASARYLKLLVYEALSYWCMRPWESAPPSASAGVYIHIVIYICIYSQRSIYTYVTYVVKYVYICCDICIYICIYTYVYVYICCIIRICNICIYTYVVTYAYILRQVTYVYVRP
jgi:hypothetical protein